MASGMLRLNRLLAASAALSALLCVAQPVPPADEALHDAQTYHLHGKLEIAYRGWRRYLAVRLDRPATVDFGAEGRQHVTSIELNPLDQSATVAAQAGGVVDAEGSIHINPSSPNYLNGVMLMADSVRMPDGALLHPAPARLPSPPDVEGYLVTVTMLPKHFEWQRTAVDLSTGKPLAVRSAVDGCTLNGGGDVMNCGCTSGFEPVRAGVVAAPLGVDQWERVPASQANAPDPSMAQFELPDADARHPQVVQVVCRAQGAPAASNVP